ncbi:MAG: hypothetical protein ACQEWD_14250 [Bacteroidota bacterium]
MAKNYSPEHVALIYKVDLPIVKKWMRGNIEFPAADNAEFAKFLGQNPKSLKGPKKKKKKLLKPDVKKKQKTKTELARLEREAWWIENLQKIENCKYRESAKVFREKLLIAAGNNLKLQNSINNIYNDLPRAKEYVETHCDKKYFTWHDLHFVEKGLRADPNVCFLFIPINGPTRILEEIQLSYFQEKYKKELYKIYINRETGKTEILLSEDISRIKRIVEKHIHKRTRRNASVAADSKNHKLSPSLHTSEPSRLITYQEIIDHYSHNEYIQLSAQLLGVKGRALAIWEYNNGHLEESLLLILPHRIYSFVIWENINENRACYIFKYKSRKFESKLNSLKNLVTSEQKYKRENLFRRTNFNDYDLQFEDYRAIIHENPDLYREGINNFISPYFSFK